MPAAYLKSPPVLPSVQIPYWCAGKEAFESGKMAAEIAARSRRGARGTYLCRTCGSYHIGTRRDHGMRAPKSAVSELIRSV